MKKVVAALIGAVFGLAPAVPVAASSAPGGSDAAVRAIEHARDSGAVVVAWNQELLRIVRTKGAQPATIHPTRSFAILHAAIYDAVVSITRDAPPYLFSVDAPDHARPDAAAAEAGHDTLVALYPTMKPALDQQLAAELAAIPDSAGKQRGLDVGHAVAAHLLAIRADDGSGASPLVFIDGAQPGDYRRTPPNFPTPVFTHWSKVTPFVLPDADQFRPAPPPSLQSPTYAMALNEVKSLGQDVSTTRTADQTVVAKFWAASIWNYWNEIAQNAANAHGTDLVRTASLFASLNLSFADSTIAFYDAKYTYHLWRPVTAIRLADTVGNPATTADPTWNPLAVTAADPSYPGAHSTISAAGAAVLSSFFGDRDKITVTSEVLPATVRTFDGYHDVATEAGLSRIFAGQHTRLDHQAGLRLGRDVARLVLIRLGVWPPLGTGVAAPVLPD